MPRLTFITLGARDLPTLRAFYRDWGWTEGDSATEDFAPFDAGGVRLALYPLDLLTAEAAPGEPPPPVGWNGVTLAVNRPDRAAVDAELARAEAAGATAIAPPREREWGGYSGYVADPEGNRWEVAWAPD